MIGTAYWITFLLLTQIRKKMCFTPFSFSMPQFTHNLLTTAPREAMAIPSRGEDVGKLQRS